MLVECIRFISFYFDVDEIIDSSILKKYGVEALCQRKECRLKGNDSKPNRAFAEKLTSANIEFEREFVIGKFSYDFKVGNILIEVNPTATHNSTWAPKHREPKRADYHQQKSELARKNGYHCIHVWDWDDIDKIIFNFLAPKGRVYARNCEVRLIPLQEEKDFLNTFHFQGYVRSEIALGLYYDDILVQVMTFGKPRYNKNYEYELLRLCSSHSVIGGSKKLFKHFCLIQSIRLLKIR